MTFQTIGEILDRVRKLHRQLQACYETTADRERDDERLVWLLEYMGWHERQLDAALEEFQKEGDVALRDTWVQYVPDKNVRRTIEETEFGPGMDAEQIIRKAIELDAALMKMFEVLATANVPPRVKRLFESLLERERTKSKDHSRRLAEMRDTLGGGEGR